MELKPINTKKEILYPTKKEVPKSKFMKEMLLVAPFPTEIEVCYVATPSYIYPINICKLIRNISIFIAILSSIMLFINKIKINKFIKQKESEEKIKKLSKNKKIKWWILGISIAICIITSIVIFYFENQM